MAKSERAIQQEILLALGHLRGVRVARNNTGAFKNAGGQLVKFGVFRPGGADIIGLMAPHGRFLAVEVKRPGERPTEQQENFARMVAEHGGLYVLAHSAHEAVAAVRAAMREPESKG